jgi:hypothetical protein
VYACAEKKTHDKSTWLKQFMNERTELPQPSGGRIQHAKTDLQLMYAAIQASIEQRHLARTPSGNMLHFRRNIRQANSGNEMTADELRKNLYERYTLRLTDRQFSMLKQHLGRPDGTIPLDKFSASVFENSAREVESPLAGDRHQTTAGGGRKRFEAMQVSRSLV